MLPSSEKLLEVTPSGIYCPQGGFYIDPWKPVDYAVITHAHSDHARAGSKHYLCHTLSKEVLLHRLGPIQVEVAEYGATLIKNGVQISLHPAGHVPGSAQIKVQYKGNIWVVSGDYKLENDGVSTPFEPQRCQVFITESTFGLPVYRWQDQNEVFSLINDWWRKNALSGKASILAGYSFGKAQRILAGVDLSIGRIYAHGSIQATNGVLEKSGLSLPGCSPVDLSKKGGYEGALILCPPSALGSSWVRRFAPFSTGYCSGWMSIRGARKRKAVDRGFVLSDHADWDQLLSAVAATEASKVLVTHGYTAAFSRHLTELGLESSELHTDYGTEE